MRTCGGDAADRDNACSQAFTAVSAHLNQASPLGLPVLIAEFTELTNNMGL